MNEALTDEIRKHLAKIGKKGAAARDRTRTAEQAQELGRRAVQTRWAKASQSLAKPKNPPAVNSVPRVTLERL